MIKIPLRETIKQKRKKNNLLAKSQPRKSRIIKINCVQKTSAIVKVNAIFRDNTFVYFVSAASFSSPSHLRPFPVYP